MHKPEARAYAVNAVLEALDDAVFNLGREMDVPDYRAYAAVCAEIDALVVPLRRRLQLKARLNWSDRCESLRKAAANAE